jgi:hypothetical protein
MNSDSAFIIGSRHEVCQDYAVAGGPLTHRLGGEPSPAVEPYVVISDGCSSSPDTDIGARLLVKAAERLILSRGVRAGCLQEIHEEAAREALAQAELIGLRPQAADATLLTAHLHEDTAAVACYGDGVVVFQTRNGPTDLYSVSYSSGYPLYPSYVHQPQRLRLVESFGGAKEVKHYRASSGTGPFVLLDSFLSDARIEIFTGRVRDLKLMAVVSDGVHSFFEAQQTETSRSAEAVTPWAPLSELLSFKSLQGAFVARRMKRFQSDCRQKGWRHLDDLALGAVYLGG